MRNEVIKRSRNVRQRMWMRVTQMTRREQGQEHQLNKKAQVPKERSDWNLNATKKNLL